MVQATRPRACSYACCSALVSIWCIAKVALLGSATGKASCGHQKHGGPVQGLSNVTQTSVEAALEHDGMKPVEHLSGAFVHLITMCT